MLPSLIPDNIVPFPVSKRFEPPNDNQVQEHCVVIGLPPIEGEKFMAYFESVGWSVGRSRKPMVSWRGALRTWKLNWQERQSDTFVGAIAQSIKPHGSITRLKAQRFEEIKTRIKAIKDGVTGLNSHTLEEIAELKKLRAEKEKLSAELGLA